MKKIAVFSILIFVKLLFSDTNFRVMSYNTLNFDGTGRLAEFETILSEVQPDILITQEVSSESGSDAILNILNTSIGGYARAAFVNDGDLNNMIFYKTSLASLIGQAVISAAPRDISEYQLLIDGNSIRFYSCHLKSSDSAQDEAERLAAVTNLRTYLNALPAGTEFVIAGDMNFYESSETGYQKFIADEINNNGRAADLCSEVGDWHNNYSYRFVHTQSPRATQFGGGAGGGLDDKFDFLFSSYDMNDGAGIEFSTGSFTSFGNDGNHYNTSVNDGANSAVSDLVADALHDASDHLPIYGDFVSLSGTQNYLIISEYIEGSSYNKAIEIYNGTGVSVDLSAYSLEKDSAGNESWGNTYNFSGILANDDVFVLAHPSSAQAVLDAADDTNGGVINFNGDDQIRLLKYGIEADRIGIPGDITFGANVTFVRNSDITNPQSGPQDPRSNGEWTSYPSDTFSYLGSHDAVNPTLNLISPNGGEEWERGDSYDITWSSVDFTGNVKIELYKLSGRDYTELVSSTEDDGTWQWAIPTDQTIANDYKIKISDASDGVPFDESDDLFSISGTQISTNLFISEYIEGSSYNKYLEIFNGSGASIDLSNYSIKLYFNGNSTPSNEINLSGNLEDQGTFVIAHTSATIFSGADLETSHLSFNGDDAIGLYNDDVLIDVVGETGTDPGTGWNVAGTSSATANYTIIRKSTVISGNTNWASSSGTDTSDSEWTVYSQDYFDDLGSHTFGVPENLLPEISNVIADPETPSVNETISVSAVVTDADGSIVSVILYWGTDGITFPNTISMSVTRENYTTTSNIPGQTGGVEISYYVFAEDDLGGTSESGMYSYTVPNTVTIYNIQGQTDSSPMEGQIVITSGIVTADFASGYFLQDGSGAWNGIYVYGFGAGIDVGDELTIQGEVDEYSGFTEIKNVSQTTVNSIGNTLPAAVILSTNNCNYEDYESVLVQTTGTCDSENPDAPIDWGEWSINDGTGTIRIDDNGFLFEPVLGTNYQITGPTHYKNGAFKIEPRDAADIIIPSAQPDAPDNVGIEIISGTTLRIFWDNEGYEYKIYSDSNPYGTFLTLEATVTDVGEATLPISSQQKYYKITAE
jgi:predicted extracellular nuclease